MANIGMVFDATKIEPACVGGGQLPVSPKEGWKVIITDSEMKETAAKDGGYLELNVQIVEGEHAGTEGKYRLNIFNKNEQAQNIAHKQLSALCHVTGVFQITDSALLHNRPFRAVVGLQKGAEAAEKGYTEIKGVLDINGNQPGKAGSAPAAPPVAPVQAPVAPPVQQQAAPAWQPPAAPEAPAQQAAPTWGAQQQQAAPAPPPWASKPA